MRVKSYFELRMDFWKQLAPGVVMGDEVSDAGIEFTGQVVILEQDLVFHRTMSALDLALGHGVIRLSAGVCHFAPLRFWEVETPPTVSEPPLCEPCHACRGQIEDDGRIHFCEICGAWGEYGYDATGGQPGRWFCRAHRPEPELPPFLDRRHEFNPERKPS